MRRVILAAALVVAFPGTRVPAQAQVQVSKIVREGLDSLIASGYRSAITTWLVGSPLLKEGAPHQNVLDEFQKLEDDYGKPVGSEVLKIIPIGSRVVRVYAVLFYGSGPGYLTIETFQGTSGVVVTSFTISGKPDTFLPFLLVRSE